MPLGPKQQPPYYVPETIPTPPTGGGSIRVYSNTTHVPTVSTTLTVLYNFDIPANTLIQTGDAVKIIFTGVTAGAGAFNTKLYIDGNLQNTLSTFIQGGQQLEAEIIRTGTTTAQIHYNQKVDDETLVQVQEITGLDFTTPIEIEITGQSGDATVLTAWAVTMDKYTL